MQADAVCVNGVLCVLSDGPMLRHSPDGGMLGWAIEVMKGLKLKKL